MARKTALQKLHTDKQPHIVSPIPTGFPGWRDAQSMVVSCPLEVDALVRQVTEGRLATLGTLRDHLARRHGTDIACPVSTAIFLNIVAAAAEEQRSGGETDLAPYWRVLKADGTLNEKYPGGVAAQKARLEAEGFALIPVRQTFRVVGYEDYLAPLTD